MPSARSSPARRIRMWLIRLIPLALSAGLLAAPLPWKERVSAGLERSVFFPFRAAVGWGPRSLTAEWRRSRYEQDLAERRWRLDEALAAREENARLRRLIGFQRRSDYGLVPAEVLGRERGRSGCVLVARPGTAGRVEPAAAARVESGMAALSPEGLVGRVRGRAGAHVRIECLRNLNMAASVLNQRSREGGILRWNPETNDLVLEGIPAQADWKEGDRIVTSGLGTAFPRGILVGWVSGHRPGDRGLLQTVTVRPAADAERVEEVYLMARDSAEWDPGERREDGLEDDPGEKRGDGPQDDPGAAPLYPADPSGGGAIP